jgi:hypothetical protein
MAKLLKDVLKGKNTSTKVTNDLGGYKPKAGDEEDFAKKHEIEKKDHTNSPEHQFNGNPQHYVLNSKKEKRHGYMAGTDEKVYESKKAEDVQCNRTPKGTECPMHGLNECMSGGTIREKSLKEVLTKKDPASKWIHDFVHSKNPKFDGKSTKDRQQQALAAYYAKQRNEEVEAIDEKVKTTHENPLVTVHDKDGLHTHANLSTANKIFNTKVKHTDVHAGPVKTKDGHETKNNLTFAISKHHASAMKEDLAVPLLQGDSSSDESAEMAKAELKAIANQAMNLVMQIPDSMTVEPWVQSKIAQAKVMISSVHDYMVYGDHDKENEQTDTPMDITTASNPTNTFPNKSVDVGYNV